MRLPAPLSRLKANVHKNSFGHVLIIAGSRTMTGAACLTGLASMRSGAGLTTLAIPKSLNSVVQKKASPVLMTLPLNETQQQSFALSAFKQLEKIWDKYQAVALGPGLSQNASTAKLVLKIIEKCPQPIVVDADGLNALSNNVKTLLKASGPRILTPHPGEMVRLTKLKKKDIEDNRSKIARNFAQKYICTLLLKGPHTVVTSPEKTYINKSGNSGMATGGSGDVLTGMIAAFLAQGLSPFEAAKYGAYIHGKAGDFAAKKHGRTSMIASDIIDHIGQAIQSA